MQMPDLSKWPSSLPAAKEMQENLRAKVSLKNGFEQIQTIAGIDVSYDIKTNISRAVIILMKLDELKARATIVSHLDTTFPYIPGYLSFREIPVILKGLSNLNQKPDLLMVDGQGIAHPRRLGIAAHLGVLLDVPAIGVAKSRLIGTYQEPGINTGSMSLLEDKGERIGTVLRSKLRCKPLFISPGHRVDQETAIMLTLECLRGYRLPEPTRIADKISKTADTEITLPELVMA